MILCNTTLTWLSKKLHFYLCEGWGGGLEILTPYLQFQTSRNALLFKGAPLAHDWSDSVRTEALTTTKKNLHVLFTVTWRFEYMPLLSSLTHSSNKGATVSCEDIDLCVYAHVFSCVQKIQFSRTFQFFISSLCVLWARWSPLLLTSLEMFWRRHG